MKICVNKDFRAHLNVTGNLYAVYDSVSMKRTLVLAVDRDDDFGVKGHVVTPVVGIEDCMAAANALGTADPEDSDLNALYAGISTCMDLQEEGVDAVVALICGDEKVGHKSDLALVSQLEAVLDQIKPDNVILIGDGAEDEYIYPIISSRAHVDSVRKVYVKQAPNVESAFYVFTKMLSEPNKRKRFVAPLGALIVFISLFMLAPDLVTAIMSSDISMLPALSRDVALLCFGVGILMYAYSFGSWLDTYKVYIKENILNRSTRMAMTALALGIVFVSAVVSYFEIINTYNQSIFIALVRYASLMVWPIVFGLTTYVLGLILDELQENFAISISNIFDCFSIGSLGLMAIGLLDIILYFMTPGYTGAVGIVEVLLGIIISFSSSYIKRLYRPVTVVTE